MSNKKPFEILVTADGSPTIRVDGGEPMHALPGALSESIYNYSPTILWALEQPQTCIHSIGLGVGYNEILCYAHSLAQSAPLPKVVSFESDGFWTQAFEDWLLKDSPTLPIYNQILNCISSHFQIEGTALKETLRDAFEKNDFRFAGPLQRPFQDFPKAHGILYDAYSSQTDPQLWEEDFLLEYFQVSTHKKVQVSTYAATGILRRALLAQGFKVTLRPGFGKKRNSTLANRT